MNESSKPPRQTHELAPFFNSEQQILQSEELTAASETTAGNAVDTDGMQ